MKNLSPQWLIIDLGGSIIAPPDSQGPDTAFSAEILQFLYNWLRRDLKHHLGLVIGGGAPARHYQQAVTATRQKLEQQQNLAAAADEELDCLGVRATHLNGEYLRLLASSLTDSTGLSLVAQPLLTQYNNLPAVKELGRIVVGGGWKPGFSTDYDSVLLAQHVGARRLLCLSNIPQIYSDDPSKNPAAKPFAKLDWEAYRQIVGDEWRPGRSVPFDPVASKKAAELGLELIFADGRNLDNLAKILSGENFLGTVVQ